MTPEMIHLRRILVALALVVSAHADTPRPQPTRATKYAEPVVVPPAFNFDELGMIEPERRQYAENFARLALVQAARHADAMGGIDGFTEAEAKLARKLVGLALHLDPRSRTAIIANGRLKAGSLPKSPEQPTIAPATLASLLIGRAGELRKAGGAGNLKLAGCFLDLATLIDPANDEAIYACETFKLAGHRINWDGILNGE